MKASAWSKRIVGTAFLLMLSSPCWALDWTDHVIDTSYPGGSESIMITRNPVSGTFGVLGCSVGSGDCPLYFYEGSEDTWSKSFVANVDELRGNALAYDPVTGEAYVSYFSGPAVAVVKSTPTGWSTPTLVASAAGITGQGSTSIAFDPSTGNPCIAYHSSDGTISFGQFNGVSWINETIKTGMSGFAENPIQLAFDPITQQACVAYTRSLATTVSFDRRTEASTWTSTSLSAGSFANFYDLKFNPVTQQPGMLIGSTWDESFTFAEFDGMVWNTYVVQGGEDLDLTYLADGTAVVLAVGSTGFTVQALFPTDDSFTLLDSFSYGASNWSGPLDCVADGQTLYVAYNTANTGRRLAVATIPEPAMLSLITISGLMLLRRKRK